MENKKDIIGALRRIRPEDAEDIQFCRERLKKVIDSAVVSEESIREIYNSIGTLLSVYNKFVTYNISLLKHDFMER